MKVMMTSNAKLKLLSLLLKYNTEIGWFGTVTRLDDVFCITDILVQPQKITSATVRTDDEDLMNWKNSLANDVYNTLLFYGHSHNTMGVTPSVLDMETEENTTSQLRDGEFYIYTVMNKKGEQSSRLYIKEDGELKTEDITINIFDEDIIEEAALQAKVQVLPSYTYTKFDNKQEKEGEYSYFDDYSFFSNYDDWDIWLDELYKDYIRGDE